VVWPAQVAGAGTVWAGCPGLNGSTMGTNPAADVLFETWLLEAWLFEAGLVALAEAPAALLLDPELPQAASRPAAAVSTAIRARYREFIRPMTCLPSRVPMMSQ